MEDTSVPEPSQSKVEDMPEAIKSVRKFTVKRDTFDPNDKVVLLTGPVNLPEECFDLQMFLGPVRDQGDLGSCTGQTGMGISELLVRKYFQWMVDKTIAAGDVMLSAMFQYYNERMIDGDVNDDSGSSGRTMMRVLVKYGISLQSDCPYDVSKFTQKPSGNAYASAQKYRPGAYHRVLDIETAKSVIFSGYPFSVSADVYSSFMSDEVAKTGKVPLPGGRCDKLEGGHEFYAYAYSDKEMMADGLPGGFLCRNSWGAGWGLNGSMWIPYRYMGNTQLISDLWTCHFGKPWRKSITLEQHAKLAA